MAATARKTSFVWISYDVDVFLLMVGLESAHSCSSAVCILVSVPCTVDSILHGGTIEVHHG